MALPLAPYVVCTDRQEGASPLGYYQQHQNTATAGTCKLAPVKKLCSSRERLDAIALNTNE